MNLNAWNNFLTYSLQVALLVGVAGWIPAAVRLRSPKARLVFFQALLVACLLLPAMRPWKTEVFAVERPMPVKATPSAPARLAPLPSPVLDPHHVVFALLAAGALVRLGMLALGMLRLRRYRLRSTRVDPGSGWACEADIRISEDIAGPVTFGFLRPVILLPVRFIIMPRSMQDAILSHEVNHVRRGDWLFTAAEEFIRAGLWFHPAIWWLLGEIQLAREQAVDRAAIDMTNAREGYVDALLAAAGAPGAAFEADLAPAPLFLRKRHLKQRVVSILKEKEMSKKQIVSTLAASFAVLATACWYVTAALPLAAQPQLLADGAGITVDLMGAPLMHRSPVLYSPSARANKIEGAVVAQVKLDENGNVTDAAILSGPDELRVAVLQSVLSWHFAKEVGNSTRQVAVHFQVPAQAEQKPAYTVMVGGNSAVTVTATPLPHEPFANRKSAGPSPDAAPQTIRSITVAGLGVSEDSVLSRLPLHVGDAWDPDSPGKLVTAAHQIDEHLRLSFGMKADGVDVRIYSPSAFPLQPPQQIAASPLQVPGAIVVGGKVQAQKLTSNPQPIYPLIARQARISGTVELAAIIGKDGHVQELTVVSGHPLLRQASIDAVKQWVYQPTLLNEQPVVVSTTIDVIFSIEN
jgi:TonB family protein